MDEPILTLEERIPEAGFADEEAAMEAFLDWVTDRGISPYPAQEEAILELFSDSNVILKTPTGSGKSLVASAALFRAFASARRSIYTAPIKALVSEKFFSLCKRFGAENVGMMTGDGGVNQGAPIICCTAEVLARIALRHGAQTPFEVVVMDEFHYYGDRDRGMAWQLPLLTMPNARFLLMSATLGDTSHIGDDLEERTGAPTAEVYSDERPVPLEFRYADTPFLETVSRLVSDRKAPVYVVHFSQRLATDTASALMSSNFTTKEEKAAIGQALKGHRFDSPYGPALRRYLQHGVGLHHAGLLPKYRMIVEQLAQAGHLKVICGTDTLGVGINVPIRTVLFSQLCKYDGHSVDILTVRDFKQIAGRAGRKGFDDQGLVVAQAPAWIIDNQRLEQQIQSGKKKRKKAVKSKPPSRGYKHWDEPTFRKLIDSPPEALESRFSVDYGLLLSLLQRADEEGTDALAELDALISASHTGHREAERLRSHADQLLRDLLTAGVVIRDGEEYNVDDELQKDFSLYHSLSLFLLSATMRLDPTEESYPLRVLTLVEAAQENPRTVLYAQVNEIKNKLNAAMKAEGMPYEERVERLEEISWPKPMAEWIYETFNRYAERHPWVDLDAIRPKSIARDMIERYLSFTDYIRELKLERAEGALLRYLSQTYKLLIQTIPDDARTDGLDDVIAYLRATLARVDSSLVAEWERLADPNPDAEDAAPQPIDISADKRAFAARVRAELHAVLRALSRSDYDDAARSLRAPTDPGRPAWDAQALEAEAAAFIEENGRFIFDGRARLAWNTRLTPDGPHRWTVQQVLVTDAADTGHEGDVEEEDDGAASAWSLEGVIDLRSDTNPDGPLIELVQIQS